jgi:hypothetical protein
LISGVKTINVRENREEQSRMDKPETLVTLDTQNTGRRQTRDTGNIGYTRHRKKTNQRHW